MSDHKELGATPQRSPEAGSIDGDAAIARRWSVSLDHDMDGHPTGYARVFVDNDYDQQISDYVNVEDANLIAAAPELLEALQSLANEAVGFLAMADPTAHGQTNLNCFQRRIDQARAAIAKAEGR
jgi:hypothetical protein